MQYNIHRRAGLLSNFLFPSIDNSLINIFHKYRLTMGTLIHCVLPILITVVIIIIKSLPPPQALPSHNRPTKLTFIRPTAAHTSLYMRRQQRQVPNTKREASHCELTHFYTHILIFRILCACYLELHAAPLVSALVNKFGCRAVSVTGALIATFGFAISRLSTSINGLMITYGLIAGARPIDLRDLLICSSNCKNTT